MAGKTSILSVRILGDASGANKAFDDAVKGADRFQAGVDKAAIAATAALAGIAAGGKTVLESASELQQAQGAVAAIFGENADAVATLGEDAATRLGLAQSEYGNLAALLGSQLKNMGVEADALVPKTDELIALGADLAATYGGTTADAVAAVSSLMKGERDPIERYGVSIKQADIEAKKAALGLSGLEGEAAKMADTQATLALLSEQTASAHGMFASEADTAAGATARASAKWEDASAALGEQLLPIVSDVMDKLSDFATWASENTEVVTGIAIAIGVIAAAIISLSIAMKLYALAQQIQTVAQWAQNAAWLSSPITWLVLAIVALIAAIVLLWANWENVWKWMQEAAANVANWFKDTWENIVNWFRDVWNGVASWFGGIGDGIRSGWESAMQGIRDAIDSAGNWFRNVWQGIKDWFGGIGDGIRDAWDGAMNGIRDAVESVGSFIEGIFNGVAEFVNGIMGGIRDAAEWVGNLIPFGADTSMTVNGVPTALELAAETMPNTMQFAASPPMFRDLDRIAAFASSTARQPQATVVNITVNGALDPVAVGKQIRRILDRSETVGAF